MMSLAAEHGVRYTGVMIENYEDETDGKIKKQTDTQRFQYFGNMILHQGGELGYHGYNHQPLSLSNVDYGDVLPYKTWISMKAIQDAFFFLLLRVHLKVVHTPTALFRETSLFQNGSVHQMHPVLLSVLWKYDPASGWRTGLPWV